MVGDLAAAGSGAYTAFLSYLMQLVRYIAKRVSDLYARQVKTHLLFFVVKLLPLGTEQLAHLVWFRMSAVLVGNR